MIISTALVRKYLSHTALGISIAALPYSIFICHAGIIFFLTVWATESEWSKKIHIIKKNLILQLLIGFCVIHIVSIIYTTNTALGWFGVEKKIFLFLLPIALATTSIKYSDRSLKLFFNVFITSCFIGSVVCIVNSIHEMHLLNAGKTLSVSTEYLASSNFDILNPFSSRKWFLFTYIALAQGISIHPTYFALYITFCVCVLVHGIYFNQDRQKFDFFRWVLLVYFSVFIMCLSSRIMILSLLIIFGILIIVSFIKKKSISITLTFIILSAMLTTLLYINPVSRYRNFQEISTTTFKIEPDHHYTNAAQIRASLWWLAVKSFSVNTLFFGVAPGDVSSLMKETGKKYNVTNVLNTSDPHNQFLFTLLGLGFFGLLLLVSCISLALYQAWLSKNFIFIAFIFLFAATCFTESALEIQKGIAFFSIFFPLLIFNRESHAVPSFQLKLALR
jgi:O-antigen ligase